MSIRLSIGVQVAALCLATATGVIAGQEQPAGQQQPPAGQRQPGGQQGQGGGEQGPSIGHTRGLAVLTLQPKSPMKLTVTSPAFKDGEEIPYENTEYRGNIFPGLSWSKGPAGTRAYLVVVQDGSLTNPNSTASTHFTLFNIPASITTLKVGMNSPPAGATYGENIHGFNQSYAGPHTHSLAKSPSQYMVLALDSVFDLPPATSYTEMAKAMTGHVLASGCLTGMSGKDPNAVDAPLRTAPVHLETGLASGASGHDRSIMVFKGIPYAAPPVGDLRFRAPQPPIAWNGVFKADMFGKNCPQGGGPGGGNKDNMSEDCLTVNVWSGAGYPGEKRPVYVWIYGGGFTGGSGSNPEIDGEALAKKGVVVVTFNYRLGALGFLATPELSKESGHSASGNFGILDDIALLQWVHKNIDAFGGDPDRVTIGGQSAGAGSVGFVAISPLAKGLFIRAIAESHVRYSRDTELRYLSVSWRSEKDAEAEGVKWQESRGAHSLADLRAMPWDKLIVSGDVNDENVETGSDAKPPLFRPVVDGWVIPKDYSQTYASHSQNDVEFLAGNNRDETGAVPEDTFAKRRASTAPAPPGTPAINVTLAELQTAAKRKFGPLAADYLKTYPAANDDEAALANNESARDDNRISTYLWGTDWKPGTDKPVYTYYWTHRPTGDPAGAHHGSEILFAFDNLSARNNPWTDEDKKIADIMSSYWANYIATGNPNAPGLPVWPAFDAKSPTVMELGDHFAPIPVATPAQMAFWKKFFQTQKPW
jgi:para-nitrobenzyl esterase